MTTALAVGCLTACGSDSESSGATCDRSAIAEAVARQGSGDAPARLVEDGFGCADGWAYAFANVGSGEEAATVTFVFEESDGAWAGRNRETVCKSPGNEVPKAIYQDACQSN